MSSRSLLRTFVSVPLLALLLIGQASAQWSLDNDASTLSFVTVKADHVAEVHTFDVLSGSLASNGQIDIMIELASVNTLIPIRNERMQNMLFETGMFPRATISAMVDASSYLQMAAGDSVISDINFTLDIHGVSRSYSADVMVTRLSDGLLASTIKPIIVSADAHDLVTGVEALREVAGLPSISRAVPVSFSVVFSD